MLADWSVNVFIRMVTFQVENDHKSETTHSAKAPTAALLLCQ